MTIQQLVEQGSHPYCVVVVAPVMGDNDVVHPCVAGGNVRFRLFPPFFKRLAMVFIGVPVAPFLVAILHRTRGARNFYESPPWAQSVWLEYLRSVTKRDHLVKVRNPPA